MAHPYSSVNIRKLHLYPLANNFYFYILKNYLLFCVFSNYDNETFLRMSLIDTICTWYFQFWTVYFSKFILLFWRIIAMMINNRKCVSLALQVNNYERDTDGSTLADASPSCFIAEQSALVINSPFYFLSWNRSLTLLAFSCSFLYDLPLCKYFNSTIYKFRTIKISLSYLRTKTFSQVDSLAYC